ncbi:hypothetical protein HYQ46_008123 [Verticillium longisporum]|nr:hypothetical protein HYQ46_008123 [Verticillium longisporum]
MEPYELDATGMHHIELSWLDNNDSFYMHDSGVLTASRESRHTMIRYLRRVRANQRYAPGSLLFFTFREPSSSGETSSLRQSFVEFDANDFIVLRSQNQLPHGTWFNAVQYLMDTRPYIGQGSTIGIAMDPANYPAFYDTSNGAPITCLTHILSDIIDECREVFDELDASLTIALIDSRLEIELEDEDLEDSDVAPPWSFCDPNMLFVFDAYSNMIRYLVELIEVDEMDNCEVILMGTIRKTL